MHCMTMWVAAGRLSKLSLTRSQHFFRFSQSCKAVYAHNSLKNWALPSDYVQVSVEVQDALAMGKPVIALESTIITHGMPYPHNIQTAVRVEEAVREYGCVPATIGVIQGKIHIGLTNSELEQLATPSASSHTVKVSRRDLSMVVSQGLNGGTTVSGTMVCARAVGIPIFVTGGIGGVHREGHNSLDISADLTELGRTNVCVISSGVKSILDIPRTLEYLETQGVTVATYGTSKEFPAFFTSHSGIQVEYNLPTPLECAQLIDSSAKLSLDNGILIAVPIPEEHSVQNIDGIIQQSLEEAEHQGITGKDVAPFILRRVNELSSGNSLQSNIALIINNARVGAQVAVELSKIHKDSSNHTLTTSSNYIHPVSLCDRVSTDKKPVVIGASILDFVAKAKNKEIKDGTNVGSLRTSFGGVGRNIADSLARLDCDPFFVSAIGNDLHGNQIMNHLQQINMCTDGIRVLHNGVSSTYCAVLDGNGEMYCGIGDMKANDEITTDWVNRFSDHIQSAPMVIIDGNIPVQTMKRVNDLCREANVPVWFEPTCILKSMVPFNEVEGVQLTYTSPNYAELKNMSQTQTRTAHVQTGQGSEHDENDLQQDCITLVCPLLESIPHVFVTLGRHGLMYACKDKGTASFYPPVAKHDGSIVNVSGAGDCLVGGVVTGILKEYDMNTSILMGSVCASLSLQSLDAVPYDISSQNIDQHLAQNQLQNLAPKILKL